MNEQIYELIKEVGLATLEADPAYQLALRKHNRAVDDIRKKLGSFPNSLLVLEDSIFEGQRQSARVMFELGLQIGRDPASIFDLPETANGLFVKKDGDQ